MINLAQEKIELLSNTDNRVMTVSSNVFNLLLSKGFKPFRNDGAYTLSFDRRRWFLCSKNGFHSPEERRYLDEAGLKDIDDWLTNNIVIRDSHFKMNGGRVRIYDNEQVQINRR